MDFDDNGVLLLKRITQSRDLFMHSYSLLGLCEKYHQ
jgi:hypothetical protein